MVTVFIEEAEDTFCCVEEDDSEKLEKPSHLMLIRIVLTVFFMMLFSISVAIFTVGFLHIIYIFLFYDLSGYYFLLVVSGTTSFIAGYGFNGAWNMNETKMKMCGFLTLIVMLWLIVTLTIEAVNKNSLMETTYKIVYTAFLENQYGIKRIFSLFDHVVDYIQQSNKCCGLRKSLNKSQIIYQSYYTTLFWLESTNWGQMQQMEIQYNDLYHVPYVPHSCCINESAINCNLALLGDSSDNFTMQMQ
ncbi:conserved hypothetical protein [Trichinella spiralis]|uniref:hypothetical protein n=1 Tax=Trichinella spiralis TaxID=6334 RepID=UPI0001EFCC9D|nr:conserved hypothetical protein [Trichinella spiralis]